MGDGSIFSRIRARVGRRELRMLGLSGAAVLLPLLGVTGILSGGQGAIASVRVMGWWTWPIFVAIAGLVIGLALSPSHLSSLLAGFLYGFAGGMAAAVAAVMIGTMIGFGISRTYAPDVIRGLIDRTVWGRRLAAELIDAPPVRAVLVVALARLPPQLPFALGNILATSGGVRAVPLLVGTALGMAPRVGLVVWIGAELSAWQVGTPVPAALLWSLVAGVVGFGGLLGWSWWVVRGKGAA